MLSHNIKYIDNQIYYNNFKKIYNEIPDIKNTLELIHNESGVSYFKFNIFKDITWINQGFSTKQGGVSQGIYESMNLTYSRDDNPENVLKNFHIIGNILGISPDNMVYSKQTHTTNVKIVDKSFWGAGVTKPLPYEDIDGLITKESNVCLVTAYADCIPVVLADAKEKVIASSHAGWRGTVNNIVKNTITSMKENFNTNPEDIVAFVGPGICMDCYEISYDVALEFKDKYSKDEYELIIKAGRTQDKYYLNLPMANVINLINEGVSIKNIAVSDICTCCNPDLLFSHRATGGRRGILCNFIEIKTT